MTHPLDMVRKFMLTMKQSCPWKAGLPDSHTRELRHELITEENDELRDSQTIKEALDGICDLLYVVHGAAITYGFTKEQVDGAFAEVHRSNMTKLWTNEERDAITDKTWTCTHTPEGFESDRCWLVKNAAGKVLKSPSYSPANLKPFLL